MRRIPVKYIGLGSFGKNVYFGFYYCIFLQNLRITTITFYAIVFILFFFF